jgi:putative ABC transport system permease protein
VNYEKNYDQFNEHVSQIYRIKQDRYNQGELRLQTVAVNAGVGPSLKEKFPEVETVIQLHRLPGVVQAGHVAFKEDRIALASKDFFRVFSFHLLEGVDSLVLKEPFSIVLSQSAARRYFAGQSPIGKLMRLKGKFDLKVTGVYEDMPDNSHFHLDMLISFDTYYKFGSPIVKAVQEEPWKWDGFFTYIMVKRDTDIHNLQDKLPSLVASETGDWLRESNQELKLYFQPLASIHLNSSFSDEWEPNADQRSIYFLQLVAIFILLIAWVNYISITTAKAVDRGKEVGVRKVLGSYRSQLIIQFILEAFVFNAIAIFMAFILTVLLLPNFNSLIERHITLSDLLDNKVYWLTTVLLCAGTLISGFYPAWLLSSFKPALALKGKLQSSQRGKLLRKAFVLLPFCFSMMLISCLTIIFKQIHHLKNMSLGFSLHQKLVIRDSEIYDSLYSKRMSAFKTELTRLPGIESVTYLSLVPGDPLRFYANGVKRLGADDSKTNQFKYIGVDENFIDVFDLQLLAGNNFNEHTVKLKEVLINQVASELLGFKDPQDAVEEKVVFRDDTVTIKGVVNNFYHESPKNPLHPVIYLYDPDGGLFFVTSIETKNASSIVKAADNLFTSIFPSQPFNYFFLDENYDRQYKTDIRFERTLSLFSVLLFIITGLGLFGLATFNTAARSKEISIRKVLGASEIKVVTMFLKEYAWMIAIACIIAIPSSWYFMQLWLQNFSSRITITFYVFVFPLLAISAFTLCTIGFQTVKAALSNPVKSLRQDL